MLGGGSNVLIGDRGVRGLVIRPRGGEVQPGRRSPGSRRRAVTINGLVRWTINRGYAGLEAWAGTPGTVGGAMFGNAHWKSTNIGDLIESVRLARRDGTLLQAPADRMDFDYDYSRLKRTGEVVHLGGIRGDWRGGSGSLARRGSRIAGVSQAHAAARIAERRVHLHESRQGARPRAGGHSAVGRRAGRSGRPERRGAGRGARVADPRQLHHHQRRGDRRRHQDADRRCRAGVEERFGVTLRDEIMMMSFGPGSSQISI